MYLFCSSPVPAESSGVKVSCSLVVWAYWTRPWESWLTQCTRVAACNQPGTKATRTGALKRWVTVFDFFPERSSGRHELGHSFRKKNFVSVVEVMVNEILWQQFKLYICFPARQRQCIKIYGIMQSSWNLKKCQGTVFLSSTWNIFAIFFLAKTITVIMYHKIQLLTKLWIFGSTQKFCMIEEGFRD